MTNGLEKTSHQRRTYMKKHPYQTCLRMPLTLKEDMTNICDRYQINESDLMRRAIVEFVTNIQQNPNNTSRHMFF
jgi:hypothetical protein